LLDAAVGLFSLKKHYNNNKKKQNRQEPGCGQAGQAVKSNVIFFFLITTGIPKLWQ